MLNIYFLSRALCCLYLGMVDQQIFLSSSVIRRAQDLGHKHSLGIALPPGPVPVKVSEDIRGSGGNRLCKIKHWPEIRL